MAYVMTRGDASERCLACGLRQEGSSWYIRRLEEHTGAEESVGFPVCSFEHGLLWFDSVVQMRAKWERR